MSESGDRGDFESIAFYLDDTLDDLKADGGDEAKAVFEGDYKKAKGKKD